MTTESTGLFGPYSEKLADKYPKECERVRHFLLGADYGLPHVTVAFCTRQMKEGPEKTIAQVASAFLKR